METVAAFFLTAGATAAKTAAAVGITAVDLGTKAALATSTTIKGLSISQVLSGSSAAFGTLSAIQQARAIEQQAQGLEVTRSLDRIQGERDANDLREQLLRSVAYNRAAAPAAGISLDSGTIEDSIGLVLRDADRQISASRLNTRLRTARTSTNILSLRSEAKGRLLTGITGISGNLFKASRRKKLRGTP